MKPILLPLLCLSIHAHGQLVNFADTTGQWHVADTYPHGSVQSPGFTETATTLFHYAGDSLVDAAMWSIMMAVPFAGAGGEPAFIGCARHVGDVVLFRDTAGVADTLYDFSLQVGDSVYYPDPIDAFLHVAQTTTVLVANEQHRVIRFNPFMGQIPSSFVECWIEGIGSIHGPLFPRYPRNFSSEVPGDSMMLTCHSRAGDLLWSHPGYPGCTVNILLASDDWQSTDGQAAVWPNPGSNVVHLSWSRIGDMSVVLRDAQGRAVLKEGLQSGIGCLDTAHLANGLYVVQLIDRDGASSTTRWVKQ